MIEVPETHQLDLRKRLHWIVDVENCPLSQQPERIARLADEMPHSIQLLQQFGPRRPDQHPRSCHAFTFDLLDTPALWTLDRNPVVPSAEFVQHMISLNLVERPAPAEGDVAVYFEGEEIQHSGRWRAGRVHSKWGSGHVWNHETFEAPSSYGCVARFYRALTPSQHQAAWAKHAEPFAQSRS